MLGRVKKFLNIEGVKATLELPASVHSAQGAVEGILVVSTISPSTISKVSLRLLEGYSRGRGEEKLIDEYEIGNLELPLNLSLEANTSRRIAFRLPFSYTPSDMEEWGSRNFVFKGLSGLAGRFYKARCDFRVEATLEIPGAAVAPFCKASIDMKKS